MKDRLGLGKKLSLLRREVGWEELWRGAERGLDLPTAWGARAVAGSSIAFVNPGLGVSAEQMSNKRRKVRRLQDGKVEMGVPASLVGAIAG